jgi:heme/copper-type cytochrome/quinol oxidase subunit 3
MPPGVTASAPDRGALLADRLEPPLTPGNPGVLGMWTFLAGDAMIFGAGFAAYGALRINNLNWPAPADYLGIAAPAVMTFILICSSFTMVEALDAVRRGMQPKFRMFMALTVLVGLVFLGMQAFEWNRLTAEKGMSLQRDLFDATFFILTGFQACQVFAGVVFNSVLLVRGSMGRIPPAKAGLVEIAGLYWHFVAILWIMIFTFVYLI